MTITLRTASGIDLEAINARYAEIGFVPSEPGELIVVAELDGQTAGQGRVVPIDERSGELGGIYVLPGFQGRGVARRIVDFLIHRTQLPLLYCLPFAELEAFYGSMGFVPVREQARIPRQVREKHRWCAATYDKPVLLLERIATADDNGVRSVGPDPSEKQKMLAGEFYSAADPELQADLAAARSWMDQYNSRQDSGAVQAHDLLSARLGAVGAGTVVRPPFHCDYGFNIKLGSGVFLNFNCVILDVVAVTIGDMTQIGPGVQILTADHPRDAALRAQGLEFGRPVVIGKNVWIGAGALIMPGVTIGDNAIVGAGSVVTRDVPEGLTVMGNPARVRGS